MWTVFEWTWNGWDDVHRKACDTSHAVHFKWINDSFSRCFVCACSALRLLARTICELRCCCRRFRPLLLSCGTLKSRSVSCAHPLELYYYRRYFCRTIYATHHRRLQNIVHPAILGSHDALCSLRSAICYLPFVDLSVSSDLASFAFAF